MRRKVLSSLGWSASAQFVGQLLTWAVTIWVIRLLSPEDYGLMALVMLLTNFLRLINEMGLGASIVQRQQLEQSTIASVLGLLIAMNMVSFTSLVLGAPLIAAFFEEPLLERILPVAALQSLLFGFGVLPDAMLRRRMAFGQRALLELGATAAASASTLLLALHGFGVWSLVLGNLVHVLVRVTALNIAVGVWCWPSFRFSRIGSAVKLGSFVTLDRIIWYAYTQADVFLVGKFFGRELLGFYSVAINLATLPMQKVSGILGQVGLSAFSLIQTDLPRVGANLCRASHVLSLLAFPVFLGISSVAPELVSALLGEKWQPVVLPLQILSVVVPLRMLAGLVAPALVGIGRPDVALGNVVIAFFIMVPAFVIGMGWGLVGVSLAWALAYPVQFFILLRRSLPVLHSSLSGYLNAMRGAAVSGALMYLVVMSARDTLESVMVRPAMQLGLLIFVGMITYLSLLFIIHRQAYRELVVLIRP